MGVIEERQAAQQAGDPFGFETQASAFIVTGVPTVAVTGMCLLAAQDAISEAGLLRARSRARNALARAHRLADDIQLDNPLKDLRFRSRAEHGYGAEFEDRQPFSDANLLGKALLGYLASAKQPNWVNNWGNVSEDAKRQPQRLLDWLRVASHARSAFQITDDNLVLGERPGDERLGPKWDMAHEALEALAGPGYHRAIAPNVPEVPQRAESYERIDFGSGLG